MKPHDNLAAMTIAESHRHAIGCSQIAQALGISRWGTRYELWLQHTGREKPDDLSDQLRVALGEPMETVLKPHVEARLERSLRRDRRVYVHPTLPLIGHVDYRASKMRGEKSRPVVDMKSSLGWGAKHRFGEDGTDEVDDDVMLQMQGYLRLTKADLAIAAALVPGPELKLYFMHADKDLHKLIEDGIADYWRLVTSDTPPDPSSEAESRQRWTAHRPGKVLELDPGMAETLRELAAVKAQLKELRDVEQALKDRLIPAIADADEIEFAGTVLATYRANRDGTRIDWQAIANAAGADASLIEKYTTKTPGARVLRLAKTLTED